MKFVFFNMSKTMATSTKRHLNKKKEEIFILNKSQIRIWRWFSYDVNKCLRTIKYYQDRLNRVAPCQPKCLLCAAYKNGCFFVENNLFSFYIYLNYGSNSVIFSYSWLLNPYSWSELVLKNSELKLCNKRLNIHFSFDTYRYKVNFPKTFQVWYNIPATVKTRVHLD